MRGTLIVAVLFATLMSASAGTASAAPPNPPNCMAVDMGTWAREGSTAFDFSSGAGWGRYLSTQAKSDSPFGADNLGAAMVAHLAGDFFGVPGVTCEPPPPE